jgi:hypothetical protein
LACAQKLGLSYVDSSCSAPDVPASIAVNTSASLGESLCHPSVAGVSFPDVIKR